MNRTDLILKVRDLSVRFRRPHDTVHAVNSVSFDLLAGETLALVGESGCGKSVTSLAIMGLLQRAIVQGSATLDGVDLLKQSQKSLRSIRGNRIAMIFQDPMTSLNPVFNVGWQIIEALCLREPLSRKAARARAIELLSRVGIADPKRRVDAYPHELSGGMRQRVMIAIALARDPAVLIADEPTTALDVTIQAQILELIRDLQKENGMSVIMITHDLGVVSQIADRVAVMYAGKVVEQGDIRDVFDRPSHGYTRGLFNALPENASAPGTELSEIGGTVPLLTSDWKCCAFAERCEYTTPQCRMEVPVKMRVTERHSAWCFESHRVSGADLRDVG